MEPCVLQDVTNTTQGTIPKTGKRSAGPNGLESNKAQAQPAPKKPCKANAEVGPLKPLREHTPEELSKLTVNQLKKL
jgi:hypothetical protein